ncbi:hypothetical protein GS457_04660 [Rhodococcus hoagii]|nr:hypothetical protein [Prescottella equi]MBM4530189.1 hypothetical protein [Prescottella equi]MBM4543995.1 hypothetical protein [Prescottella equi]MBM4602269.1 hypothetical protein [Prescottella equi]
MREEAERAGYGRPFAEALLEVDDAGDRYQRGAQFIRQYLGVRKLNGITRGAVARACPELDHALSASVEVGDDRLIASEMNGRWSIPEGCLAIAKILHCLPPERRGAILTTNFDPLVGIAMRKIGLRPNVLAFDTDGSWKTLDSGVIDVVHLHGYWRATDTLHCSDHLSADRPKLARAIANRLRDSDVFVLGYGGWNDAFTRLVSGHVAAGDFDGMELIWSAFGPIDQDRVAPGIDRGFLRSNAVCLYERVDANVVLGEVADELHRGAASNHASVTRIAKARIDGRSACEGRAVAASDERLRSGEQAVSQLFAKAGSTKLAEALRVAETAQLPRGIADAMARAGGLRIKETVADVDKASAAVSPQVWETIRNVNTRGWPA